MTIVPTALPEVVVVEPRVFRDARGWFVETYQRERYAGAGIAVGLEFVQDNRSSSTRGVLRGLHYQLARSQGKLVHVTRGAVFDVAVDLRRGSPTFGRWAGATLSADDHRQIWIPPGFAHGGVSAMLLDEMMGWACYAAGMPAMTISLEVRYRGPVPIEAPLLLRSRITATEDRKLSVEARMCAEADPETVLVSGTGVFVAPDLDQARALFPGAKGFDRP